MPQPSDNADYHAVFSRVAGPPRQPAGKGAAAFAETEPLVTVTMDAGAFLRLWELAESEGKRVFSIGANQMASASATLRAVRALRSAWWRAHGIDEPDPPPVVSKPMRRALGRPGRGSG